MPLLCCERSSTVQQFFVPRTARELAFVVLCRGIEDIEFASKRLEQAAADQVVSPADRRLAMELIYGTIRRQATLDAIIKPFVRRGQNDVESDLWMILRIGAYQLVLLDGIPPHAALNETVELAKRVGRAGWPGFINGVLRSVSRLVLGELSDHPAADAVPLADGRFRKLGQAIFPDPETQPAEYFEAAFSFPEWLARRWQKVFSREEFFRLGTWFNLPSTISLRVNQLKTNRDDYLKLLADQGLAAHAGTLPESIHLTSSVRVEDLPQFEEGWVTVQDESSMHAARLMAPRPGDKEKFLDLCAAPGGKTTHLAELLEGRGMVTAVDVQSERLMLIDQNVKRLGLRNVRMQLMSKDELDAPIGPFDGVLVDVPCSNTGVLGKRPEARWRIMPGDLRELPALQRKLLNLALDRVRPGGRVVYSTCSIEPDENRGVVDRVLQERPNVQLVEERQHVPGLPADGGYQALLVVDTQS
jgi:16S rRNA (cytosine967-C5)-methyltransferase